MNEDKTLLGALRDITPDLGFASGMESLVTGLDAILENTNTIVTGLEEILISINDIVDNTDVSIFQIIIETFGVLGVGLAAAASTLPVTATAAAITAVVYGIARLVDTFLLSSNGGSTFHTNANYDEPSEFEKYILLTNHSTVPNQSESDFATLFAESDEFTKQFTEAYETSFRTNFETSYNTIYNSYLEELEKLDMLYVSSKPTGKQNLYKQTLLPYTTGENKISTNTVTGNDIQENMYKERNCCPQKVEHIYDIPIINYITVNEAEKNDYDEFARKIKREIVNEILSLKTETF